MASTTVRTVLESLAAGGSLTASAVLEAATPEDHPLHPYFLWDDELAGHQYRLGQARRIILSVKVRPEGARRTIPVYIHTPADFGEGEYISAQVAARQPDSWERARDQVLKALAAAQDNLEELEETYRLYHRVPPDVPAAAKDIRRAHQRIATVTAPA